MNFCEARGIVLGTSRTHRITPSPISFSFPAGKAVALIGPNGAGKTTLLRALAGEPYLKQGELHLAGLTIRTSKARELASVLAIVPQEHHYPTELRVTDLLRLAFLPKVGIFGQLPPGDAPEIQSVLNALSLSLLAHRSLRTLSTGERQRVFLARALLQKPKVLLLDEPTNHLDPGGVYQFWECFTKAKTQSGFETIISTHDLTFVRRNCEWICALKNGALAYNGTTEKFFTENFLANLFGPTLD